MFLGRILVELLPFDPEATRNAVGGGVDNILREVKTWEGDDKVVHDSRSYGEAVRFPARIVKASDEAQDMSQLGDLGRSVVSLEVDPRDLLELGLLAGTGDVPFKKGDKITKFIDAFGVTMQERDDLFISEVRMTGAAMFFRTFTLECGSRGAVS